MTDDSSNRKTSNLLHLHTVKMPVIRLEEPESLVECCICNQSKVGINGTVWQLKTCDHSFHHACLFQLLLQSGGKCPICEIPIALIEGIAVRRAFRAAGQSYDNKVRAIQRAEALYQLHRDLNARGAPASILVSYFAVPLRNCWTPRFPFSDIVYFHLRLKTT